MYLFFTKIGLKLSASLSTLAGWLSAVGIFIADYFAGHTFATLFVVGVTFMDALWGIAVSIKQGKFTLSELARLTVVKLAIYGCALAVFVGIDKMIDSSITASALGAIIALVELWSSCASMLILYPHMAILQLIKKHLTGEIASKLGCDPSEVESVMEQMNKKKKPSKRRKA
jgi:hypothetical protein